jgi:hypothetical protein
MGEGEKTIGKHSRQVHGSLAQVVCIATIVAAGLYGLGHITQSARQNREEAHQERLATAAKQQTVLSPTAEKTYSNSSIENPFATPARITLDETTYHTDSILLGVNCNSAPHSDCLPLGTILWRKEYAQRLWDLAAMQRQPVQLSYRTTATDRAGKRGEQITEKLLRIDRLETPYGNVDFVRP